MSVTDGDDAEMLLRRRAQALAPSCSSWFSPG